MLQLNSKKFNFRNGQNVWADTFPNKYITRLAIRKCKIRNHTDILPHTITMAKTKSITKQQKIDNIKCWGRYRTARILIHYRQKCKMVQLFWKIIWQLLIKLTIHFPYDSAFPLLDTNSRDIKTYIHTKLLCNCV